MLDVESWGINIATFVVTYVKSAVSAVHGIFHAIGVDIDRAIRWIRLALDGLIGHVEENAQTMLTLIGALPTQADSILGTFSSATNTFFARLRTDINDAIGDVIAKCDGNTFADFEQSPSTQLDHDGSGSLFPANLGASDELATPSADWGPALAYTHGIVRIIMAPVTAAGSMQTYYQLNEGQEFPLAWYGWFGVVSNLYLLTTTWPGVKVNGLTPPPYTTAPDTTGLTNELAVGELAPSWANPLLNAAAVMCKQSGVSASSVEWMPYVTTIIALGNLILTGIVDVKRNAKPELFAIHMLERTPPTLTPFLTPAVADGSELLTLGLKVFCDIGMNVAAGGLVLDTA